MSDRDVKSWMERISSDVEMLKRRLIRRPVNLPEPPPPGVIDDPDNPLLRLDGREEFRTVSGGQFNGDHWSKIATIQIFNRFNDAQLIFTATPRSYGESNRIPAFIFARVKQQDNFGNNPYARITIYPGGTHPAPENLRIVVTQNTPSSIAEIYLKLDQYTLYGIKPIHVSGNGLNVEWHHAIPSVASPPTGLISHTATYAKIDQSAIPDTGWKTLSLASGYTAHLGHTPQYRIINGVLYLRGTVKPTSGNLATSGQNVFTNAIPELVGKVSDADEYDVAPCLGPTGGTIMRVYVNRFAQLVFGGSGNYGSGVAAYLSLAGASGKFHFS